MRDTLCGSGRYGWRHRRGEDEAWGGRADGVADHSVGRDITSRNAEAFGQGSFYDVNAVHDAIPLGHTGASGTVETDGMDLVKVGESTKSLCQIAYISNRGDVAIHGVNRFKGNHLGAKISCVSKQHFEMIEIVVPEDPFFSAARPNPRNHRRMIFLVG